MTGQDGRFNIEMGYTLETVSTVQYEHTTSPSCTYDRVSQNYPIRVTFRHFLSQS